MRYKDLAPRTPQHTMVYGDSKSGKSTLVSRLAADGFDLQWFSLDGGHTVISKLSQEAQDRIDITYFPDTREWPIAFQTLNELMKAREPNDVCDNHGCIDCSVCRKHSLPFTTYHFRRNPLSTVVVIDHMTALTDSCMNIITKKEKTDYKLQLDDYGAMKFWLTAFMKNVQVAPFNIVCIAQTMEAKMEDNSVKMTPSIGSYEYGRTTGQYFDHIVLCKIQNQAHKFASGTLADSRFITGSRSDVEIEKLSVPSLAPFFQGQLSGPALPEYGSDLPQISPSLDRSGSTSAAKIAAEEAGVSHIPSEDVAAKAKKMLEQLRAGKQ